MKRLILFAIILLTFSFSAFSQNFPLIYRIKQVSQLPAQIPQRVQSAAFDGRKLWFSIYQDNGHYATYDPRTKKWRYSNSETRQQKIGQVVQPFAGADGMVFVGRRLWLSDSHGDSFGYINTKNWQVGKVFYERIRPDLKNSQTFADMTFDGKNIWLAWHLFDYRLPVVLVNRKP